MIGSFIALISISKVSVMEFMELNIHRPYQLSSLNFTWSPAWTRLMNLLWGNIDNSNEQNCKYLLTFFLDGTTYIKHLKAFLQPEKN